MASPGVGALSMATHLSTLSSNQTNVDRWVETTLPSPSFYPPNSNAHPWADETDFSFHHTGDTEPKLGTPSSHSHEPGSTPCGLKPDFPTAQSIEAGPLTLSEEDLVAEWDSSSGDSMPLHNSKPDGASNHRILRQKSAFTKTIAMKVAIPGASASVYPQPRSLLRSFSDMTFFNLDHALTGAPATADDTNKPPLPTRRRGQHAKPWKPVIFTQPQIAPLSGTPPLPSPVPSNPTLPSPHPSHHPLPAPLPSSPSLPSPQLSQLQVPFPQPPPPNLQIPLFQHPHSATHQSPTPQLSMPHSSHPHSSMAHLPSPQPRTPKTPGGSHPPRPRHRVVPSTEILPPITPRADPLAVNYPFTSSSVGGAPLCPSPELPDEACSATTPQSSREDCSTVDTSSSVDDNPSVLLSPMTCSRSRSMSVAPGFLAPSPRSAAFLEHSFSLNQRQSSEVGFRRPSSAAASTPRAGGSCRLSPRQPVPPLRLGPLVEALAEGGVDAIRDAACSVRIALKGSKENKTRLIQAGGILSLIQLAKSLDAATVCHGVTALFNVCRVENAAGEIVNAGGIAVLVAALQSPSPSARENAAAAIFCLADNAEYRARICDAGAIPALVEVLRTGSLRGQKDAALALFNLLKEYERGKELVDAGGVQVLLSLLQSSEAGLEDKAMAVLAFVSKSCEGREAIVRENGLLAIIDVLELASQRAREDAVAALFQICNMDVDALGVIAKEGVMPALHKICQSPSERAKAKARALLQLLRNHKS